MITILVPSRGRPAEFAAMRKSAFEMARRRNFQIALILDADDPRLHEYHQDIAQVIESTCMADALRKATIPDNASIVALMGDDIRFRTKGWDTKIASMLEKPGIAYGNDKLHGPDLATHWFVTRNILDAAGSMVLPPTKHFFLDNAWTELGRELGILRYVPDVVTEHLHFTTGKSQYDDTYKRSQQWWTSGEESTTYNEWRASDEWTALVERVRNVL